MDVTGSPTCKRKDQQPPPSSMTPSTTSQYHAQLYSEQKRLQNQLLQQQQQQRQQQQLKGNDSGTTENMVRITLPTLSFETPNLYRTSLKLAKELHIQDWWTTVVDLLTNDSFRASRVTLCVPQDASDPYRGPWGLKALYDNSSSNTNRQDHQPSATTGAQAAAQATAQAAAQATAQAAAQATATTIETPSSPSSSSKATQKCFDRLQSLDSELAPLIINANIQPILDRNDIVVVSREYRSQSNITLPSRRNHGPVRSMLSDKRLRDQAKSTMNGGSTMGGGTSCVTSKPSKPGIHYKEDHGILAHSLHMTDYDEYEQQQPSPWSHSPAPSSALMDPDVNPFFQSIPDIDDEAFNPDAAQPVCNHSTISFPPPASNAHSLVHIPIVYPGDIDDNSKTSTPIAILSFLSPVVPYPVVLLKYLRSLQSFLATSLSNALAYSRIAQSQFTTTGSSNRKPLLRRHSYKIKRWPSQTFASSSNNIPSNAQPPSSRATYLNNSIISTSTSTSSSSSSSSYSSATSQCPPTCHENHTARPSLSRNALAMVDTSVSTDSSTPSLTSTSSNSTSGNSVGPGRHMTARSADNIQPSTDPMALAPAAPTPSSSSSSSSTSSSLASASGVQFNNTDNQQYLGAKKRQTPATSSFMQCRQRPVSATSTSREHKRYTTMRRSRPKERCISRYLESPRSSLLRLVIDGIPIHVFTCSTRTGKITWVNNRILQYTGKALDDHLGPGWLSHMHPDDQKDFRQAWDSAFEQGNGFAGEYRLRRFDGIYRSFLWRIVPLRDTKGKIIHWFGTCTDIHDEQLAKENNLRQTEIESNERKYRLLADAIPQIVFTFSPGIGLTYTNGKWEHYFAQSFDCTKGFGFISQVHQDDRHNLQLPDLAPHNTAGIDWHTEIRLLGGDGRYRWFLVKCISVDELDTGEVRWFGTCTDINDHKLLEHKLKEAHNAAQKSTESKTRFLSNMSHEIRTPLIGITGMLNFLLDTNLTAEQLDYAHTIQQSAESLLVVINDILDLSKVEAGMMKLLYEPFSLVAMMEDANELLSTLAIQKGLELSFWVDDDVPAVVSGDRIRLRQVLLNLIGNAIKFTTEGEVYTRCQVQQRNLTDTNDSTMDLLFEVMDTGAGFDSDGEAVMFKPFSQVDSSSTRKHGGSGLGLVISRQLVELHGGKMGCSSKKGHGSTFSFTAKVGIPSPCTQPQPQTPQNENIDPFYRTDAYKVVHDLTYRQELLQQQQRQQQNQQIDYTGDHAAPKDRPPLDLTAFSPSPMAHSIKHSQTNELSSPNNLFRDVLANKPITMQLKVPPKRKQQSSPTTTLTIPTISLDKASKPTPPTSALSTPGSVNTLPSALVTPDHMSVNTATVILPPRTPTRLSPLRILIVCQWPHSRDTMERHVRRIVSELGSNQHYVLDIATNVYEAQSYLRDSERYDYILVNMRSETDILTLTTALCEPSIHRNANVMVVTTPIQRSALMERVNTMDPGGAIPKNCGFVFKPLKRSKLNWYFGIRDTGLATTTNHKNSDPFSTPDTSQRTATTQKEVFNKMESDVGGKGFRILLVEDNPVNQKVLTRYLVRVGLLVDVANDGEECVAYFMDKPYGYYSMILCDLFMPKKDGFEATREIRQWEETNVDSKNQWRTPIVALSANVMSDVASKCLACGFSTYISKPVNFAILSDVMRNYLLPGRLLDS